MTTKNFRPRWLLPLVLLCLAGCATNPMRVVCATGAAALKVATERNHEGKLSPATISKVDHAADTLWPSPPKSPVCNAAPLPSLTGATLTAAQNAASDLQEAGK